MKGGWHGERLVRRNGDPAANQGPGHLQGEKRVAAARAVEPDQRVSGQSHAEP